MEEKTISFKIYSSPEVALERSCYPNDEFCNVNDFEMIAVIKKLIELAIIDNRVYYDSNDIEQAIEEIYPVIENIIFNSNFKHIRDDFDAFFELITYLVIRLA